MCGRAYRTYTAEELAVRYLNQKDRRRSIKIKIDTNFNLAPTQPQPVVISDGDSRDVELQSWGLIPAWSPEFKMKLSTINAKSETVFESKLYARAVKKRRCIVPITGFYEWKRVGEKKQPYAIHLKDKSIISLAGIWEVWHEGDKDEQHSFSILTTSANKFMAKIHDRMPVILQKNAEDVWLSPDASEQELRKVLKPFADEALAAHPVSTIVNSPRNNAPECIEPLVE